MAALEVGQLADRYEIEAHVESGTHAEVYRARHTFLGTRHALKVLRVKGTPLRRALVREGRVQALLLHPNLVRVTDAFAQGAFPVLVIDWVEGPSLADWLADNPGPMKVRDALILIKGIVRGIGYAHQGRVIHRDLKPENVLLSGPRLQPRVADFGLVKVLDAAEGEAGVSAHFSFIGTPEYMAPEQILDPAAVDARADLWSVGAILYELVTGHVAFEAEDNAACLKRVRHGMFEPPESLQPELPQSVVRIIKELLRVKPDERIRSAQVLAGRLDDALRGIG